MTELTAGFAGRLRELAGRRSISKFSKDVGLGESLVRKYLEGSKPRLDRFVQIATRERVNYQWLATGEGDKYSGAPMNEER